MAYPVNPTEFRTSPHGLINQADRLRFATFGFMEGMANPNLPLVLTTRSASGDPVRRSASSDRVTRAGRGDGVKRGGGIG